MTKKNMVTIECPYCNKTMGKQGIYGHIRGNHKEMENDYRTRFPPKMTSLKPTTESQNAPEKEISNTIEETMTEEESKPISQPEQPEHEFEEETPVPASLKTEEKENGDTAPTKGKSFLDWLFGDEDEDKEEESGTGKPGSKKNKDEDDWW